MASMANHFLIGEFILNYIDLKVNNYVQHE